MTLYCGQIFQQNLLFFIYFSGLCKSRKGIILKSCLTKIFSIKNPGRYTGKTFQGETKPVWQKILINTTALKPHMIINQSMVE